jgi:hypothetical protein
MLGCGGGFVVVGGATNKSNEALQCFAIRRSGFRTCQGRAVWLKRRISVVICHLWYRQRNRVPVNLVRVLRSLD